MYEIELKAHVDDRTAVIAALNSFARYGGSVQKEDTYYKLHQGEKKISARIRREIRADAITDASPKTAQGKAQILLTYKRKELRTAADGAAIEVNDEKECALSDAEAVESLLTDIGFAVSLKKHKSVHRWEYDGALLELCNVPPLGDFLEIEILSPVNDSQTTARLQKKLESLLAKAGVPRKNIERRYYSDMLRALDKQ